MSFFFLFLGCFILYGKSRFFPYLLSPIGNIIKKRKQLSLPMGYLFLMVSYVSFSYQYGWATGFIIYIVSLSLLYSVLVVTLTLVNDASS